MEKPAVVKTHLRNMIVVPEMIGSVVGIHNGKTFNQVEIKVCGDSSVCGRRVCVGMFERRLEESCSVYVYILVAMY